MLKTLNKFSKIKTSTITTVHSYTSDQPLLDTANFDLKEVGLQQKILYLILIYHQNGLKKFYLNLKIKYFLQL